tara:strand:- start:130 stop:426 length:297 start_codon:yes stop_codon:yes gene_type:complete
MSRLNAIPYFPNAPEEYNRKYISEIVRAFSVFVQQNQTPGEGRNTFTVFTALQTDDSGLENGAVFQQGGFLKVALVDSPHVRGLDAIGNAGTVTVAIT